MSNIVWLIGLFVLRNILIIRSLTCCSSPLRLLIVKLTSGLRYFSLQSIHNSVEDINRTSNSTFIFIFTFYVCIELFLVARCYSYRSTIMLKYGHLTGSFQWNNQSTAEDTIIFLLFSDLQFCHMYFVECWRKVLLWSNNLEIICSHCMNIFQLLFDHGMTITLVI